MLLNKSLYLLTLNLQMISIPLFPPPKGSPKHPVMTPGDPERARRAERLAEGLPLAPDVWESLLTAGESKGLERSALEGLCGR